MRGENQLKKQTKTKKGNSNFELGNGNMLLLVHILAIRAVNILPTSMPPETYSENFATPFHLVRRHTPAQTVCQKPSLVTRPVARISKVVIDNNFIIIIIIIITINKI